TRRSSYLGAMITFLKGVLLEARPTSAVVGVDGVGYEVIIPLSTFDLLPRTGAEVTILTHLHMKDDGMVLYGFMTEAERALFRMLLGVTGIGPKIAVAILSGISPERFGRAVREGSARVLAAVPGIGRKKAERLIVELRDKIGPGGEGEPGGAAAPETEAARDAALALVALGYTQAEAQRAVRAALERTGTAEVEALIREALRLA
ncbi:MAG: Holliday junction branch migration protein RuvA, partial [bacterium]|nr:Holliday junction branch migration protein RuvA [bacterium]